MRLRKFTVIALALMLALGSAAGVFAADRDADYSSSYSVSVKLVGSEFDGDRVEVLDSDGNVVKAWKLDGDGELIANLAPGSYTLREVIELNGYEIPKDMAIMVGGANIVPVDPNPSPEDILPDIYYDMFQEWINQLT